MSFQPDTSTTTARHASPHLGLVATIFTVLKLAGIISLRCSVMYLAQSALTAIPPTINALNTIGEMASTKTFQLRARKLFTAIQNCKMPPAVKSATRSQCVVSKRW